VESAWRGGHRGVLKHPCNDVLQGKLGKFSLVALMNLTAPAGLTLEIRVADAA